MSPERLAWTRVMHAGDLLARVETRLAEAGAVTELRQFGRLSAQEMARLLEREARDL